MSIVSRKRRAPQAVSPQWAWVVGPFTVVANEPVGVLAIGGTHYTVEAIGDDDRIDGFRLMKESGECYDIDILAPHGWTCDCPDGTYCPERPGGCKHIVAVRQAMAKMTGEVPVPQEVESFRQAEADLQTLAEWATRTLWAGPPCTCHDATCSRCRTEEVVARHSNEYRRMKEETPF